MKGQNIVSGAKSLTKFEGAAVEQTLQYYAPEEVFGVTSFEEK